MAVILDESAREVVAARRERGKEDRIYLRLQPGSMRAATPLTLVAGWAPREIPEGAFEHETSGGVTVYMGLRIARYALSRDVVISGFRFWRWHRLVIADPFAYEHLREWEYAYQASAGRPSPSAIRTPNLGSGSDDSDYAVSGRVLVRDRPDKPAVRTERNP
jgi:hypothetical protein